MFRNKEVFIRDDDGEKNLVFTRYAFSKDFDCGFSIEDAYCGGYYTKFFDRLKRAWNAFNANPVFYTSVYVENEEQVRKFLSDCLSLLDSKQSDAMEDENDHTA